MTRSRPAKHPPKPCLIFSPESVRRILAGKKTQTRRVIRGQESWTYPIDNFIQQPDRVWRGLPIGPMLCCPYEGKQLWVKEPWSKWDNGSRQVVYKADRETREVEFDDRGRPVGVLPEKFNNLTDRTTVDWQNSMFMPHWASRLTLKVTNIRIERVQEISEEDSIAEGVKAPWMGFGSWDYRGPNNHREAFQRLWESINGKKHPWSDNPWVWVIEFQPLTADRQPRRI